MISPHTPRLVSHTARLALAPPLLMVQIGYTPPTCRFSVYTTRASPSWCICTKPTRGHSITYIYFVNRVHCLISFAILCILATRLNFH